MSSTYCDICGGSGEISLRTITRPSPRAILEDGLTLTAASQTKRFSCPQCRAVGESDVMPARLKFHISAAKCRNMSKEDIADHFNQQAAQDIARWLSKNNEVIKITTMPDPLEPEALYRYYDFDVVMRGAMNFRDLLIRTEVNKELDNMGMIITEKVYGYGTSESVYKGVVGDAVREAKQALKVRGSR